MNRILLCCYLAACATTAANEQPGPRGLRADQHLAIASREADRAQAIAHWPDSRPGPDGSNPAALMVTGTWYGSWDTVADHERLARLHRDAAAQIEAQYEDACGDTPAAIASVSPLQRYGIGGTAVESGIVVLLSADAGPPDRLLAAMRCHRAWMMLGRTDMDNCPLDLPGIHVDARGDANGIELTITVADPALVDELRRRAALDLEAARRYHTR